MDNLIHSFATVTTDQGDYAPGETAIISGSGFALGETIQLQVLHTDGRDNTRPEHQPWQITDGLAFYDEAGNIVAGDLDGVVDGNIETSWFVDSFDSLNSRFELIAVGLDSNAIATTNFTDSYVISGTVFNDYDSDGVNDGTARGVGFAEESGVEGITVTAYNASEVVVGTATTGEDGTYTLNINTTDPVRIEFTLPSGFVSTSLAGVANDTVSDIAFTSTATTMDLGIHRGHEVTSGDGSDISLITVCYVEGVGTGSAIVIHNYNDFDDQSQNAYTQRASVQEIGTVNGLAYHRESETLFAGSFYKRHSALLGTIDFTNDNDASAVTNDATGAAYTSIIYTVDNSTGTGTTGNVSVFARLDDVVDPRGAIDSDAIGYSWENDQGVSQDTAGGNAVFDAVGKYGLGDLELSPDGTTLWAVNLNDRKLYRVPVGDSSDPLTPATPDSSDIDSYDLITGIINNGDDLGVNPELNIRPFALSIRDGLVYFGMVNSAQFDADGNEGTPNGVGGSDDTTSASDLRAFVYTFDPENPTAAPVQVLDFPLNYERDSASNTSLGAEEPSANWHPWVSSFPTDIITTATEQAYTQPILSDIDFDVNGNMLLGFRDRWGDQIGQGVNRPDGTGDSDFIGNSGGDLLAAILDPDTGTWTIETHVTTDNINGNNDPDGELFGNEFFENGGANDSNELHSESAQGGLTVVPGFTEVVTTAEDPIDAFTGGFEWFNTEDGSFAGHFASNGDSGLDIYNSNTDADTFGKSNGLGDLEFIYAASDIEVGNRIWDDTNQDGIQNAGETNFDFVGNGTGSNDTITVELYDSSGILIDTETTSDGEYYFSGLEPFTDYEIRLAASNFTSGSPLDGYLATIQNTNGDGSDKIDSDATNSGGLPSISFTTGASGTNDYSFDFGLTNATTTDYGDAPDTTSGTGSGDYQTTAANSGASHTIVSGISIGSGVSADDGTLQNSDATADSDDGVTFTSTLQTTDTTFSVDVDVNVTGSTTLVAWIDFDQSGTFDSDEAVSTTVSSSGTETLTWNSFPGIIDGATYARFRLSTDGNLDTSYATGAATDGEVEDYLITIGLDYGDAPDASVGTGTGNYQTTSADTGASHGITTGLNIGSIVDPDNGTLQNTDADNDNTDGSDDEEGVTFGTNLSLTDTSYSVDVDVTNTTGEDALLTGWIDFDQSGTFDADEEASVLVSTSGSETLTWDSLPGLVSGTTYSRFRLSTNFTTTTESTTTPVTTTVYSENFDSSPTGWDVDPNGTDGADSAGEGQWEIGSPSSETRGGVNVQLAPFSGSSSLVTGAGTNQDVDNGVTTVRSPNFSLSADTVSYDVSFQYYLGVVDNSGADPGDNGFIARIVRESDDTVIETFVTDQPNANQTATWTAFSQSYDFSGFEGETVYLEFLSDDGTTTGDVIEASVDDIDITFTEDVTVNVDVPDPLASTGFLDDGEVEDYKINIAVDYGDAPDTSSGIGTGDYQTTAENDGASHIIDTDIRLGTNIDADDGTLQNTDATADDIDNTDDEDGVTFTSNLEIDNSSYSVDVDVNLNFPSSTISVSDDFSSDYTGGSGWLAGWTETGETTDENNGNIDIQSGILHIQDDTASISRQFDFSSATGDATLSFNYSQNSLDNANEGYDIIIDDGIGGSPTTVFTIDDSTTDSTAAGEFASVSIPQSFLTSTTTITIQSRGIVNQGTGDDAYIDNIDISAPTGSGTTATLVGWIDFDQSGTFDSDEAASTTVTSSGTETLTWNSLPGITAGTTYSRFRLSTDSNLDSDYATGQLSDGEVEDYKLTVGIDYGDARDTGVGTATGDYSTTANDNGPSHIIDSNLSIGANVDADDGTLQNTGATADDDALNDGSTDDEDGITFGSTLRTDSTSYSVTVDINNDTGNDAEIIGWIDFDQSGTFDSDEATTATFGADAIGQTLTWSSIPADITDGDTYVRFRLSTDDTLDVNYSTGQLSDGEVEDYQINIVGIDYGDAPDVTVGETNPSPGEYATTLADGGASHTITDGLKLGLTVDAENGTLQNTAATADDLDNNNDDDDEDGVTFNSTLDVSTTSYSVTVDYTNSTGGDAIIIGWIDFDQSGTFDADEAVSSGTLTTDELDLSTTLTWNSFPGIVGGTTYARFRLNDNITNLTTSTATGELDGGEVEDYLIFVGGGTDYGDAPDSYGTLIASSGASHDIVDGLNIGSIIDAESDGQDSVGADGDNNNDTDDEDGVTFTSNLETTDTSYSVDVDVNNTTGADVTLAGWIDFDGSGTFESDESTSVTVSSSGTQTLTWSSLPGITAGTTYARFRLGNNETSIFSENFDSSPTGWTVNPDGTDTATLDEDGQWIIDDPVAHDRFGDASNDQLEANSSPNALVTGSGDTNTDVDITSGTPDGVTTVDSPDFTLPSVFDSLNLSLEYYLSVSQANDDNFTIELRQTSDNALLSTLLNETPTATQTGSWTTFNASLDSFGGSTVYLRFIATDVSNDSVIEVGVDDISVVSTSSTLDPTGAITNGEVEDYQITITATDYGDAPDTGTGTGTGNYQTTANDDGAAHTIISGLSLGSTAPDADNGTLQNNAATADNNDSTDDEDGVDFTAVSNLRVVDSSYSIDVDVTNTTGNDAVVVGWIDFDQSGTFDSDEAVSASANSSDPVNLTWSTIPTDILPGTTYARFRISNDTTTLTTSYSTGLLSSGEVEDYAITIDAADYGDAPDTASGTTTGDYSTTASDGGAAHGIDRNLFLGSNIDADDGTQQNDDADADDQTTLGQLNYEYFDLTSDVDSVDDIPESGADVVGTLDPDLDLVANADQGDTDDFGIRYTGFINITTAGTYTFYTTSDDGSTLSIEDTLVVNNDGEHASATQSGDFTFSAPGYYPIQVEFFEATGSQSLTLQYEGPGITSPINIPGSVLAVEVDDENGVTFTSTDIQTSDTSYSVDVSVFNNTGGDAEVIGWIDFDRSGTFDSDEAVIRTISTNTSSETVTLTWDNNGNGFTSEDISEGITYARFRLSSDTTTLTTSYSTGNLTDGEVEDYQINIIGVDYGDAPDDGVSGNSAGDYQTLADNGGASHIIIDDLYLGGSVDADDGTLEDRDAVADDNDNIDDEDGVTFNNILSNGNNGGNDYTVDLVVTNETGGDAKLVGWIDLDQDGNFEASEAVTQTVPHAIGGQNTTLTWSGLSGVLGGTTYARFRVTTDSTLDLGSLQDTDSVGQFDSGEVEDYQLAVQGGIDYGDAPDTGSSTGTGNYQTLSSDSGASHTIVSDLFIGDTVDEDDGTLQDSSAIADDNDLNNDEDGVNFLATLEEGDTDYSVTVDLTNDTGSNATIVGWIDFNQDGAFDANEAATATVSSSSSEQTATLTWSDIGTSTPTLLEGETYARFRLSTDSALDTIENSDSTGLLSDGEVEDYHICVVSSGMGGTDGADSITADAGGSVIAGYKGQDTLTGGAGVDHFCYSETSDGVDIINGFTVGSGGDQIMLTQILRDEVGYTGTDPISDGYVVLVDYGATGTMVQIDFDGSGSLLPKDLALVVDTGNADINETTLGANNLVF